MWPTTFWLMKSWAQFDMTTYSRYQARKATVAGHHEAEVALLQLLELRCGLQPVVDRVVRFGLLMGLGTGRVGHGLPFPKVPR